MGETGEWEQLEAVPYLMFGAEPRMAWIGVGARVMTHDSQLMIAIGNTRIAL